MLPSLNRIRGITHPFPLWLPQTMTVGQHIISITPHGNLDAFEQLNPAFMNCFPDYIQHERDGTALVSTSDDFAEYQSYLNQRRLFTALFLQTEYEELNRIYYGHKHLVTNSLLYQIYKVVEALKTVPAGKKIIFIDMSCFANENLDDPQTKALLESPDCAIIILDRTNGAEKPAYENLRHLYPTIINNTDVFHADIIDAIWYMLAHLHNRADLVFYNNILFLSYDDGSEAEAFFAEQVFNMSCLQIYNFTAVLESIREICEEDADEQFEYSKIYWPTVVIQDAGKFVSDVFFHFYHTLGRRSRAHLLTETDWPASEYISQIRGNFQEADLPNAMELFRYLQLQADIYHQYHYIEGDQLKGLAEYTIFTQIFNLAIKLAAMINPTNSTLNLFFSDLDETILKSFKINDEYQYNGGNKNFWIAFFSQLKARGIVPISITARYPVISNSGNIFLDSDFSGLFAGQLMLGGVILNKAEVISLLCSIIRKFFPNVKIQTMLIDDDPIQIRYADRCNIPAYQVESFLVNNEEEFLNSPFAQMAFAIFSPICTTTALLNTLQQIPSCAAEEILDADTDDESDDTIIYVDSLLRQDAVMDDIDSCALPFVINRSIAR